MFRTSILAAVFTVGCLSAASAAMIEYKAALSAKSEVPPTTSNGNGDVLATLDTASKKLSYTMTYYGLTGPATAAHFHGPAAAGANAGVAVPIGTNPANPTSASVTLTDAQIKDLQAGNWYANIHTEANKGGEIRGQMMRAGGSGSAMAKPAATKASAPAPAAAAPAPAKKQ
jgi:hypothetical protein